MPHPEFDDLAPRYDALHRENIAVTGEAPEYFAQYKMRDFARLVQVLNTPTDGRYLDFGSGIGASVLPFRQQLPQAALVCADVSAQCLDMIRNAHGESVDCQMIEKGRIPLPDASLDGAFACCVFHHIEPGQHAAALAELRRVLRPGAPLMVYEHNPYNPLTVHAVNTCPLDENAILIAARSMRARCRAAGFQAVTADYRVFFPAGLRGLRPLEQWLRWLPLGGQYYVTARA